MKHSLLATLILTVTPVIGVLSPTPAAACAAPTSLEALVNAADLTRKQSGPRTAINQCYGPYAASDVFAGGPVKYQARFLFEYLGAAESEEQHSKTIEIGERYIDWYIGLDKDARRQLEAHYRTGPSKALFSTLTALEHLNKREDVLTQLERLADEPAFFTPRILELWQRHLRMLVVNFKPLEVSDSRLKRLLRTNPGHKARWQFYKDCLSALADSTFMKSEARRRLEELRGVGL